MNLQENIQRIREMMGVINESQYSNNLKRRVHILDSLIDNLLPNMYPCDYNDEDDFFTSVYHELHHLIEDEQYGLENLDRRDMIEYIYQNRQDEIREYYRERCNNEDIQENVEDKSKKDLSSLIKQSLEPMMERENNIICDIEITAPWDRESYYNVSYKVDLLVIGGPNSKYWPVTQAVRNKYDKIIDEVWDTVYSYFGQAVDVNIETTNQCNKESKEEESEGVGAYAAPAFEMKPDHVHFKHLYNEQAESKKDALKSMLQQSGIEVTSKLMGGIDNLINVLYDGDIMKFSEDTHTPLVYMSVDEMSLYIHVALVEKLGLENANFSSREKTLGKFRYGTKNGMQYAFTANLKPNSILHDQPYYKVVGTSGHSGFGYAFINKKDTLGKRYRQQIFKQIIDKYNLEPYMQLKTFY